MNKSIENIWKEGFAEEVLSIPKITDFYNQKSISLVEKIINNFKREINFLIPLAIGFFAYNIFLDNDKAVFWGMLSALPCIVWFYLGKKQIKSIETIDYQANSYEYLISIREILGKIRRFNRNLWVSSVPISMTPMLIYTYYNQLGKSIGEIFGVAGLDLPTASIFLLIPIFTVVAFLLSEFYFKRKFKHKSAGVDSMIAEMEILRTKEN